MFSSRQVPSIVLNGARAATLVSILALAACGGGGGCASAEACTTPTGGTATGAVTAASAVSVSIGTDGTINADAVSALKYSKRFVVTVVDQEGRPVLGAVVDPRVEMIAYGKGWTERNSTTFEVVNEYRTYCAAEDLNKNDILDAGEDLNGDGILTPPRSAVTIVPTNGLYTTDVTGSVVFELQYPKNYATWIVPALIVRATVTGTEGSARLEYGAGYLAGDEKTASTPFVYSPFSTTLTTSPSCTDNL